MRNCLIEDPAKMDKDTDGQWKPDGQYKVFLCNYILHSAKISLKYYVQSVIRFYNHRKWISVKINKGVFLIENSLKKIEFRRAPLMILKFGIMSVGCPLKSQVLKWRFKMIINQLLLNQSPLVIFYYDQFLNQGKKLLKICKKWNKNQSLFVLILNKRKKRLFRGRIQLENTTEL